MLFDLRGGRRRNVVKVVYATLAVLMGLSLFLVIGGFNISELFTSSGTSDLSSQYEDEAERLEARLVKEPDNPDLLLRLTRAHLNIANAKYEVSPETGERQLTIEGLDQMRQAGDVWARYIEETKNPNATVAQLIAPVLFIVTQNSSTAPEAQGSMEAAVNAQKIAAEKRPNLNTLTTLALYSAVLNRRDDAERYGNEAIKYATTKFEREDVGNKLGRALNVGVQFQQALKETKEAEKAAQESGAAEANLENPLSGNSADLGASGLGGGGTLGE